MAKIVFAALSGRGDGEKREKGTDLLTSRKKQQLRPPKEAMAAYLEWLNTRPGKPVFVGYPASYDFMFVYWYLVKFTGERPFSHAALDIETLAMEALSKPYRESSKRDMPEEWVNPTLVPRAASSARHGKR